MIAATEDIALLPQLGERQPDLGKPWELHCLRENTNDFALYAIDDDLLTKHLGRSTKPRSPEILANQHHRRRAGLIIFFRQIAADERLHSEHAEVVKSDPGSLQPIGSRIAAPREREVQRLAPNENKVSEAVLTCAPIEIVR